MKHYEIEDLPLSKIDLTAPLDVSAELLVLEKEDEKEEILPLTSSKIVLYAPIHAKFIISGTFLKLTK